LVLVATLRALRYHGGQSLKQLTEPDAEALRRGLENLRQHITNAGHFGLVPLVALNRFGTDTDEEIRIVQEECRGWGVDAVVCDAWALGGQGAEALAHAVMHRLQGPPPPPRFLYETSAPLLDKINTLAIRYYGASEVVLSPQAADQLAYFEQHLGRDLLVCMAKTQKSISDNPELLGAPSDYTFRIQEVQISAGAGFIVPIAGEMMRMPGLPKVPAANHIHIDTQGQINGLF